MLANHLLQGDKGYNIPEMFAALRTANLEFVSMVQWQEWDLLALFKKVSRLCQWRSGPSQTGDKHEYIYTPS
ncbi:MAG: hypothetical protein GDA43_15200 [Hormoscilla sp. SP5CHS1]|nr:hypothetical protein [Hormoscilla sp. SP12CHS1]MBC6454377.1 hypothetical protein [Hormoscilla sp. SP5CHS1]